MKGVISMKIYYDNIEDNTLIIGTDEEIKAIEKSIRRASKSNRTNIYPAFCDSPIYRFGGIYGLLIEWDRLISEPSSMYKTAYYIVNSDTICKELLLRDQA